MENGFSPLNQLIDLNELVVSSSTIVGDSALTTRGMLAKSWTSLLLGNEDGEDEHYSYKSPPTSSDQNHSNSSNPNLVVLYDFNTSSIMTDVNDDITDTTTQQQMLLIIKKQLECKKLRMLFSPPEMLTEDGEIEESYFRPDPSRIFNMDCLKTLTWNKTDEELLRRGINEFGNDWTAIILKYLPNWDAKELQEKCKQLKISIKAKKVQHEPIESTCSISSTKRKKQVRKESESEEECKDNETDQSIEYLSEEEKPKRKSSKKKTNITPKSNKSSKQIERPTQKKVVAGSTTKKKTTVKKRTIQLNSDSDPSEEEFNEGDFTSEDEMSDEEIPKIRGQSRPKRQVQRYCYHENSSGEDELFDYYID